MPPCTWIARSHAATAASAAYVFAALAAISACPSSSAMHHAAQYASERASSVSTYVSASLCDTAWYAPIGRPNCWRLFACSTQSASASLATPTASRASAVSARRRVAAMIFAAAGGARSEERRVEKGGGGRGWRAAE